MRIRPPEFETSISDVKYHVSLALSVIPRGSWGDVARRFTMIRWAPRRQQGTNLNILCMFSCCYYCVLTVPGSKFLNLLLRPGSGIRIRRCANILCFFGFSRKGVDLVGDLDKRRGKAAMLKEIEEAEAASSEAAAPPTKATKKRKASTPVEKEDRFRVS
ncbi:UDP-glucose flavonoid 3-O-glucosyltransferase 6-like [Dorcoceras hygrometricum]|uniref:UDP-glucose flavonoid 3-O-glucosyltransferase 6-like n=1 Tax=Dorcoceras hygrometricum TaxID=472368 RepID=A0A2Z7CXE5_9LAMI|nr:UDP-glucose flavonoid 3-O-glucosyltransferase 6-like [Dorcoceras hygrometricum]